MIGKSGYDGRDQHSDRYPRVGERTDCGKAACGLRCARFQFPGKRTIECRHRYVHDGAVVISTPKLGELYVEALKTREVDVRKIDGDAASVAGLGALYQTLEGVSHAA